MRFKPSGKKVVEMCKYIDDNMYRDDLKEKERNLIFEYLYDIIYLISWHRELFSFEEDCDNFSYFFANQMYDRIYNNELDKIKSVKNYINRALRGRIIYWQQKYKFNEIIEDSKSETKYNYGRYIDTTLYRNTLKEEVSFSNRSQLETLIKGEIKDLPKLIYKVCSLTQYKSDNEMVHKLYMSCLLTMLNQQTYDNESLKILEDRKDNMTLYNAFLPKLKSKRLNEPIILWHLGEDMTSFITLLLNRIKKMFMDSIYLVCKDFDISNDALDSMLLVSNEDR